MSRLSPGQFVELCEACPSCTIAEVNGTKYLTFVGEEEETTHLTADICCDSFQNVILEFNGRTNHIERPEGFLVIEFYNSEHVKIGSAYRGSVLGNNRCGYHRYGYIAPPGTAYGRLRVLTCAETVITLSDVNVHCLEAVGRRGRNGLLLDAHLGMILVAPRNTLESFELARRSGFDTVITNVNVSSDGILVALHNDTIDETSNGSGKVSDLRYEDLLRYDFGSWFGEGYRGVQIPTLESVTQFASVSGLHLIYRMHRNWADSAHDVYTYKIYSYIKKYGLVGKASLKVFSDKDIDYYYKIFGDDVAYIFCTSVLPTEEQITWAAGFPGDITLEPRHSVVTEEFCDKCVASGVKLSSYIVNDISVMRKLFLMGVTRFCTDTYSDIVFPTN